MPLPKPSLDQSAREETSRVQNLSSVAPPPAQEEGVEIIQDIPTLLPMPDQNQPLRILGWVMVIGGAVALALVLVVSKLRSTPAAQQAAVPAVLAVPAVPQRAPQVEEAPPAQIEPVHATKKERRAKRPAGDPIAEGSEASIRIQSRVAPVRATPDPDAKVVCSVKRGAVMRSLQQMPGSKGRWFAVHCDKDSPGWVHENFVALVRP
jgi:hypothetical protein